MAVDSKMTAKLEFSVSKSSVHLVFMWISYCSLNHLEKAKHQLTRRFVVYLLIIM